MTWHKSKKLASALGSVGVSRISGWDPTDDDCSRLVALRDMAQNDGQ